MIEHTETLHTIAQVAITLIGFSGIVIVIGDRALSKWTPEESASFFGLIAPTLTALISSFIPILIGMLTDISEIVWRIANLFIGVLHLANILAFYMGTKNAKKTLGQNVNGMIGALTIMAHLLASAGLLPWLIPIFLFGLLQQLWIGILNFLLLLNTRVGDPVS